MGNPLNYKGSKGWSGPSACQFVVLARADLFTMQHLVVDVNTRSTQLVYHLEVFRRASHTDLVIVHPAIGVSFRTHRTDFEIVAAREHSHDRTIHLVCCGIRGQASYFTPRDNWGRRSIPRDLADLDLAAICSR